jgi:TP901 family phage tail tape measure protein
MAKSVTFIIAAKDAYSAIANKVSKSTEKMKKSFKGFDKIGKGLKKLFGDLQKKILSLAVAMGSFVGVSRTFSKGMEFGAAIADLSAITGAAGKDLEYLSNQSLTLSKSFARSASETAGAFKLVASGKPELLESGKALKDVTEQVLLLSSASGVELATSAGVTTKALNQMGKGSEEAARFVNVLAAGSKFGSSEVGETGEAIVKAGSAAKLAGVNFEELNGTIQVLAQKGISGAIAGTQLKTALLRLETSGKKNITPSVVGFETALENLKRMNLSSKKLSKLFGLEAINTGLVLSQESDAIIEMSRKVTGTKVAVEQAKIRMSTFGFNFKRILTSVDNLLIKVYGKISNDQGFKKMADDFQSFVDSFNDSDIDQIAMFFKGFLEVVNALAKALKIVSVFFNSFGKSIGNFAGLLATGDFKEFFRMTKENGVSTLQVLGVTKPTWDAKTMGGKVPDYSGLGDNIIPFEKNKNSFDSVAAMSNVQQSVVQKSEAKVEISVKDREGIVQSVKQTGSYGVNAPVLKTGINNT